MINDFTSGRTPAGTVDLICRHYRKVQGIAGREIGQIRQMPEPEGKPRKLAVSLSPQKLARRCVVKTMTSTIREQQVLGALGGHALPSCHDLQRSSMR